MVISWILLFFLIISFWRVVRTKVFLPASIAPSKPDTKFKAPLQAPSSQARAYPLVYSGQLHQPTRPIEKENLNRGKSEDYFLEYLWRYFPTYIHTDIALPIREECYFPDFAFIDKKHSLYIDIEIDEPYALPFGYPTHCIGSDEIRNRFFVENHWMVIRFTEEQVIRAPKSCCKFIAEQAAAITKNHRLTEAFYEIDDLQLRPKQWSFRQSEQLYKMNYRDHYLKTLKSSKP